MNWEAKKHRIKWDTKLGKVSRDTATWIGLKLMGISRRLFKWSAGRCSWCGGNPGFSSTMSHKGLRCQTLGRDCTHY